MSEDFLKDVEMLEQPLLTDEGFINEACLNELAAAINNMPKSYDRLAGCPEWTTPHWVFAPDITGQFARWAVKQSPDACPVGLERVVSFLKAALEHTFSFDTAGMCQLTLCQINKALYDILYEQGISDFDKWNQGEGFIDLDALLHNTCVGLRDDWQECDCFKTAIANENDGKGETQ